MPGTEAVWAAGDAAAFPIKQGGLAAQQADVVARSIAARAGADVEPLPYRPVLRGVMLTGRGRAWMRRDLAGHDDAGDVARHALFWPPTKIAGRYLAPYLSALDNAERSDAAAQPSGEPVELDLEHKVPATTEQLTRPPAARAPQRAVAHLRLAAQGAYGGRHHRGSLSQ